MRKLLAATSLLLLLWSGSGARSEAVKGRAATSSSRSGFPQTVRVRLWYLHPLREIHLHAEPGQAQFRKCASCRFAPMTTFTLRATGSTVHIEGGKTDSAELHITGTYQISTSGAPALHADFPIQVGAESGHLLVTALMPMEEYVAGVLSGETGNFKSDEALKAMAVAARTYAMHFGSRHAMEGFDFCDTTHCQDLRLAGINPHLLKIAQSTAGEILWYDGEPAAAYYAANCGGTSEDARFILGNDEPRAPFLVQHSDQYCVRNGASQWQSEVSKSELQRALVADGFTVAGKLRSVGVLERTPSGRVEFLRLIAGNASTVPAVGFRSAVGRHIGWERLKSNWYDVSDEGDRVIFHGRGFGHGVGLCQVGAEVMGEEGHSYREILAFYYPGTKLGVSAQDIAWQHFANDDVDLLTKRPERDKFLLMLATRLMHESEENTGLIYRSSPQLKVYATLAEFRNSTGEPGWIAASTRGRTIRMQPPEDLQGSGALESTLRHELLHMLIEAYARPGTPLWFREGLALYLAGPKRTVSSAGALSDTASLEARLRAPANEDELRHAYADAYARVVQMAQSKGKGALLDYLQNGLPPELAARGLQRARSR